VWEGALRVESAVRDHTRLAVGCLERRLESRRLLEESGVTTWTLCDTRSVAVSSLALTL